MQDPSIDYSRGPECFWNTPYAPQKFMASIRFPTLDLSNRATECGLSSKECLDGPPNGDKKEIGKKCIQNMNTLLTLRSASGPDAWWRL